MKEISRACGDEGASDKRISKGKEQSMVSTSYTPSADGNSRYNEMGTHEDVWQNDGMHRSPSFVRFLDVESSRKKVNFHTLETKQTELADVLISMSSVLEVHARFKNTLCES
ncbi:hypothetical protein Tco_0481904 [Tanacetum coccineum]